MTAGWTSSSMNCNNNNDNNNFNGNQGIGMEMVSSDELRLHSLLDSLSSAPCATDTWSRKLEHIMEIQEILRRSCLHLGSNTIGGIGLHLINYFCLCPNEIRYSILDLFKSLSVPIWASLTAHAQILLKPLWNNFFDNEMNVDKVAFGLCIELAAIVGFSSPFTYRLSADQALSHKQGIEDSKIAVNYAESIKKRITRSIVQTDSMIDSSVTASVVLHICRFSSIFCEDVGPKILHHLKCNYYLIEPGARILFIKSLRYLPKVVHDIGQLWDTLLSLFACASDSEESIEILAVMTNCAISFADKRHYLTLTLIHQMCAYNVELDLCVSSGDNLISLINEGHLTGNIKFEQNVVSNLCCRFQSGIDDNETFKNSVHRRVITMVIANLLVSFAENGWCVYILKTFKSCHADLYGSRFSPEISLAYSTVIVASCFAANTTVSPKRELISARMGYHEDPAELSRDVSRQIVDVLIDKLGDRLLEQIEQQNYSDILDALIQLSRLSTLHTQWVYDGVFAAAGVLSKKGADIAHSQRFRSIAAELISHLASNFSITVRKDGIKQILGDRGFSIAMLVTFFRASRGTIADQAEVSRDVCQLMDDSARTKAGLFNPCHGMWDVYKVAREAFLCGFFAASRKIIEHILDITYGTSLSRENIGWLNYLKLISSAEESILELVEVDAASEITCFTPLNHGESALSMHKIARMNLEHLRSCYDDSCNLVPPPTFGFHAKFVEGRLELFRMFRVTKAVSRELQISGFSRYYKNTRSCQEHRRMANAYRRLQVTFRELYGESFGFCLQTRSVLRSLCLLCDFLACVTTSLLGNSQNDSRSSTKRNCLGDESTTRKPKTVNDIPWPVKGMCSTFPLVQVCRKLTTQLISKDLENGPVFSRLKALEHIIVSIEKLPFPFPRRFFATKPSYGASCVVVSSESSSDIADLDVDLADDIHVVVPFGFDTEIFIHGELLNLSPQALRSIRQVKVTLKFKFMGARDSEEPVNMNDEKPGSNYDADIKSSNFDQIDQILSSSTVETMRLSTTRFYNGCFDTSIPITKGTFPVCGDYLLIAKICVLDNLGRQWLAGKDILRNIVVLL